MKASRGQRGMIAHLAGTVFGNSEGAFADWLQRRFQVSSVEEITDRELARRVIGALRNIQAGRDDPRRQLERMRF